MREAKVVPFEEAVERRLFWRAEQGIPGVLVERLDAQNELWDIRGKARMQFEIVLTNEADKFRVGELSNLCLLFHDEF